jgi:hypothetical protein
MGSVQSQKDVSRPDSNLAGALPEQYGQGYLDARGSDQDGHRSLTWAVSRQTLEAPYRIDGR